MLASEKLIRKWNTSFRGRLLIHAPWGIDKEACWRFDLYPIDMGCIVGSVEIIGTERLAAIRWQELASDHMEIGGRPYGEKTFAWFLNNAKRFESPIVFKGRLGLFSVPDELIQKALG